VWQELRAELHPQGLEIVTVGIDTAGPEACRPFIEAAQPEHPSLIDASHQVAERFGVINIPNGVWIDEAGMIVRPAEPAPAPRRAETSARRDEASAEEPKAGAERPAAATGDALPERLTDIFTEAMKIQTDPDAYGAALRDWVARGAESPFALSPDQVVARSQPRDAEVARGQAHFELAAHLEQAGHHQAAVRHFREAHRLVPDNFSYKRQAWSLEPSIDGPLARFWQGPSADDPDAWPYDGDWLTDVRRSGAENYYPQWRP
jgi:tetratricopeptide (TPR) repeat protein